MWNRIQCLALNLLPFQAIYWLPWFLTNSQHWLPSQDRLPFTAIQRENCPESKIPELGSRAPRFQSRVTVNWLFVDLVNFAVTWFSTYKVNSGSHVAGVGNSLPTNLHKSFKFWNSVSRWLTLHNTFSFYCKFTICSSQYISFTKITLFHTHRPVKQKLRPSLIYRRGYWGREGTVTCLSGTTGGRRRVHTIPVWTKAGVPAH